jgi:hypothetical protein
MKKVHIFVYIIFISILVILLFIKGQHQSEAITKAFQIAIQAAVDKGYEVSNMIVSKEMISDSTLVVSFKKNKEEKFNDLEIWVRCENIYDIRILGAFENVDPENDRDKIALKILKNTSEELKQEIQKYKEFQERLKGN